MAAVTLRCQNLSGIVVAACGLSVLSAQPVSYFPQVSKPMEYAWALAVDGTGVYIAGEIRRTYSSTNDERAYVRKFTPEGAEIWTRQFENLSHASGVAANSSGVYVAGNTLPEIGSGGYRQFFLRRYDPDGNELWTRQFGSPMSADLSVRAVAADDSGVYVLETNSGFVPTQVLRRFDDTGRQLWNLALPYAGTLSVDNTGLYLIDYAPAHQAAVLRKFTPAGVQEWARTLDRDQAGAFTANSEGIYMTNLAYSAAEGRVQRYIRAFDAAGNLKWTRVLPSEFDEAISSVIVAGDGGFYIAANLNGVLEGQCRSGYLDFVVSRFDSEGNRLWKRQLGSDQDDFPAAMGVAPHGVYLAGGPYGPFALVARLDREIAAPSSKPQIHNECVLNAANYVGGGVAPGEMVTILGRSLGPIEGAEAHVLPDSPLPAYLAGTRVLFNGVPGAVLYVSDRQATAIAPYAIAHQASVEVSVEYLGTRSNAVTLPVRESRLGVFSRDGSGQGQAAAWNEDGTLNSSGNPARAGSVITFYATGAPLETQGSEASVTPSPAPAIKTEVQVVFSGPYPEYAWNWDDAPIIRWPPLSVSGVTGAVSGLLQIKVRLPGLGWDFHPGVWYPQLMATNSSFASSLATIAVTGQSKGSLNMSVEPGIFVRVLSLMLLLAALPASSATDPTDGIYGVYRESAVSVLDRVAPGSNVLIFSGSFPVGPAVPQTANGFPLVTSLAGVSVTLTIGGVSLAAYVLGAETQWIRAMLPSSTPLGDGQLVVTYNGRSSAAYRLEVRERAFGIYDGSFCGPSSAPSRPSFCIGRAVQNIDALGNVTANSLVMPARPGDLVALWGTGLGSASGDEATGPIPGALQTPGLQVLVGGKPANLLYTGRSGCCAGMDQIIFQVPAGIEGCKVPVWVRNGDDGTTSNDVYISIATGAGVCSDADGLSESQIRKLSAGVLKSAEIWTSPGGSLSAAIGTASQTYTVALGSCGNLWGEGFTALPDHGSISNAGDRLSLHAPDGTSAAARNQDGYYDGPLNSALPPGVYRLDNGGGGPALGPFQANFSLPDMNFAWTNRQQFSFTKADGLTVTWKVADPNTGHIEIYGNLALDGETSGATLFTCTERPGKGSFTIPGPVLERAGIWSGRFNEFYLHLIHKVSTRLDIPGLDFAEFEVSQSQMNMISLPLLSPAGRR